MATKPSDFFKRRPTKEKTDGEATDMEDASTSKMGAAGGSDLSSALHGDLEKGRPTPSDTDMDSGGGWVGGLGAVGKGKGRGEGSSGEGWGSSRRSSFSAMSDVEPSAHLPYTGFGPYSASTTMGSAGNDVSGFKKGGSSRGKTELVCSLLKAKELHSAFKLERSVKSGFSNVHQSFVDAGERYISRMRLSNERDEEDVREGKTHSSVDGFVFSGLQKRMSGRHYSALYDLDEFYFLHPIASVAQARCVIEEVHKEEKGVVVFSTFLEGSHNHTLEKFKSRKRVLKGSDLAAFRSFSNHLREFFWLGDSGYLSIQHLAKEVGVGEGLIHPQAVVHILHFDARSGITSLAFTARAEELQTYSQLLNPVIVRHQQAMATQSFVRIIELDGTLPSWLPSSTSSSFQPSASSSTSRTSPTSFNAQPSRSSSSSSVPLNAPSSSLTQLNAVASLVQPDLSSSKPPEEWLSCFNLPISEDDEGEEGRGDDDEEAFSLFESIGLLGPLPSTKLEARALAKETEGRKQEVVDAWDEHRKGFSPEVNAFLGGMERQTLGRDLAALAVLERMAGAGGSLQRNRKIPGGVPLGKMKEKDVKKSLLFLCISYEFRDYVSREGEKKRVGIDARPGRPNGSAAKVSAMAAGLRGRGGRGGKRVG